MRPRCLSVSFAIVLPPFAHEKSTPKDALQIVFSLFFYDLKYLRRIGIPIPALINDIVHSMFADFNDLIDLVIKNISGIKFSSQESFFRDNFDFHIHCSLLFNSFFPTVGS